MVISLESASSRGRRLGWRVAVAGLAAAVVSGCSLAGASEGVLGMSAQYNLQDAGDQQVIGGLFFRVGDAVIPMIGFVYKNIKVMFTYDVTTSSIGHYDGGYGAYELGLISQGFYNQYNGDRRQSLCPSFKQ